MTIIEQAITQAQAENLITYNRYGVGTFSISKDILKDVDLAFNRNCADVSIFSNTGCAQIRKRKGSWQVTFNYYGED